MKDATYTIHIDSFLRLTELLGSWSDKDNIMLTVPNIEGLDEAVRVVNKACSMKLWAMEQANAEDFMLNQYRKIEKYIESGDGKPGEIRKIMEETVSYYKGKK